MSEPLLKAILKLFAVAAREDEVTQQEREQIKAFLEEHLSQSSIGAYLEIFDDYVQKLLPRSHDLSTELGRVMEICTEINPDLTQKQKVVVLLEIINIVQADETITSRETELVNAIAHNFRISDAEVEAITTFVRGKQAQTLDHGRILVVNASESESFARSYHIQRKHLNGLVAVLYVEQAEIYFIKYIGGSDVYLNGYR
jgi:uncharacterized tellurite resistance protein B-like protein